MQVEISLVLRALTVDFSAEIPESDLASAQPVTPDGLEDFINAECYELLGRWSLKELALLRKRIEVFIYDRLGATCSKSAATRYLRVALKNGENNLSISC